MAKHSERSEMRGSILFAMAAAVVAGMSSLATAGEYTKDTLDTVKKNLVDGKAVLLDVREKSEWDEGHLKDAKLLPLSLLEGGAKAEEVAKIVAKGKIVYCHCRSGIRSLRAADKLKKFGYDVRPLKEGYPDLLKAGFAPATK